MLRHCPIARFSSSGARRKMPTAVCGKETPQVPPENPPADAKGVAKEPLPPQKVLKIFSINIIAQGLPFCRRRVSTATCRAIAFPPAFPRRSGQMSKVILQTRVGLALSYDQAIPAGNIIFSILICAFFSLFSLGFDLITAETVTSPSCCLPCICLFLINVLTSNSTGRRHRRCNATLIPFEGPYYVDGVFKYASGWCVYYTRSPTFLKTNKNMKDNKLI